MGRGRHIGCYGWQRALKSDRGCRGVDAKETRASKNCERGSINLVHGESIFRVHVGVCRLQLISYPIQQVLRKACNEHLALLHFRYPTLNNEVIRDVSGSLDSTLRGPALSLCHLVATSLSTG